MKDKLTLRGSSHKRVGSLSSMPVEWLGAGSWRLPSGKALAEFALQAGFVAPLLLKTEGLSGRAPGYSAGKTAVPVRAKQFGSEENQ